MESSDKRESKLNRELLNRLSAGSHIPALDAIRGIAALLVVAGHTFAPEALGRMAVSVFFVLSGFLITWLLVKESDTTGRVSLRDFYIRRTLRIFPAFYVFWIICISGAFLRHAAIPWGESLCAFFYVGDYYAAAHASHAHQIMGVTWSLGIEEKFYLLWPALFVRFRKEPAKLYRLALSGIAAIWIYRIVAELFFSLPPDYLRYAFDSRFDNILYGCALALALKLLRLEPLLRLGDRVKPIPFAAGVVVIALALLEGRLGLTFGYVLGMSLTSALVAMMLIQLVFLGSVREWRWLGHPVFQFFGRISYSLYLYHVVVIATVAYLAPGMRLRFALPLIFAGSIAAAYLSYRLVERPFLQLKGRFTVIPTDGAPPRSGSATAAAAG